MRAAFAAHRGYLSDKWEQYPGIYEAELHDLLQGGAPLRVLEIGIQNGGSLQLWSQVLPPGSRIVGMDIDPACAGLEFGPEVEVFIGDASDAATLDRCLGGRVFDVIVDDGSHRSGQVIAAFEALFPRLAPGGVYIVEDLHCSYRRSHGGGLRRRETAMTWFKDLADALNVDHFEPADGDALAPDALARLRAYGRWLARVSFYDSVVSVARLPAEKTRPYARLMTGTAARVADPAAILPQLPVRQLRGLTLLPGIAGALEPSLRAGLVAAREEGEALRRMHAEASAEAGSLRARLAEAEAAAQRAEAARRQETQALAARLAEAEAGMARRLAAADRTAQARIRAASEAAGQAEARAGTLRSELAAARAAMAALAGEREAVSAELAALRNSVGARLGLYGAYRLQRLPRPIRQALRGAVTRAMRLRAGLLGRPSAAPPAAASPDTLPGAPVVPAALLPAAPPGLPAPSEPVPRPATARRLISARFPALRPLPTYPLPEAPPRLSIVTDGIGPASGTDTALLLGAALAARLGAGLRVVTRDAPGEAATVREVLGRNGMRFDGPLELAFAPEDESRELPVAPLDLFLTTSWRATRATLGSVPPGRVAAIVEEDERTLHPHGEERLRCAETLGHPGLPVVVSTEMLFRHLAEGPDALPNLASEGMWFEPAFPGADAPSAEAARRRLLFQARLDDPRNLFWRGLEALDAAVAEGLFPDTAWEMHWVGEALPAVALARGVVPIRAGTTAQDVRQPLIASMDAGLVLTDAPHPAYPTLDLAAAGAAVLTNTHPGRSSLARYSANILMAPPTTEGLLDGLRRLQGLAEDDAARARHRAADRIGRDWNAALAPVVARLAARLPAIR
nr:class I SAM-dependent methyltransferase [Roseomonas acroporae]